MKRRYFDILVIVIAVIVLLLFVFNVVFNKGTLALETPSDTTVLINGKEQTSESIGLRPGKYDVTVVGKEYSTETKTVQVNRFKKTSEQFDNKRLTTQQIIQETIGSAYGVDIAPYTNSVKQFENNVIAGRISMASPSLFALQYDNGWRVVYFQKSGYQQNYELLENTVSEYLKKLASEFTGG